jgi:polyisoprenoid-binding protein YceI
MKRLMRFAFTAIVAVATLFSLTPASASETWKIDTAHSKAHFAVAHALIADVRGTVPIVGGSVTFEGAALAMRIEATLNPRGLTTDEPDRDQELQGVDWFDTARYPTWSFLSTRTAQRSDGTHIDGMLTIHGTSLPISMLVVLLPSLKGERRYRAMTNVDRHAFGMHVTRADALISNRVRIELDIFLLPPNG